MMEKLDIGGQAVIEGVMMRSKRFMAVAVRKKKKIILKKEEIMQRSKFLQFYFIRGVVNLFDMLVAGISSLMWSADIASDKEKISKKELFFTLFFSFGFAIILFIVVPFYLAKLILGSKGILFNIIDGLIRMAIFLVYVYTISLMKDVRRLFQYHGAEHKVVNCYENGKKLSIGNIKGFSTLHERCGTTFLMIVFAISIIVFSFIVTEKTYVKILGRVVLIPVIASISYELLKLSSKYKSKLFFRIISKPGLWMQKITTKEPNKKQIEVALKSFKVVLDSETKNS